jgi:hypothetical protein
MPTISGSGLFNLLAKGMHGSSIFSGLQLSAAALAADCTRSLSLLSTAFGCEMETHP